MTETDMPAATEGPDPFDAKHWLDQLKLYEKRFEGWHTRIDKVRKVYTKNERSDKADREYSMFWANIEVLKPAVYARPPVPVVAPRFKDNNPVAREASETLERALIVQFEQSDLDGALRKVRDDFLMYSRGTPWVRFDETVEYDRVRPKDFAHELAESWRECKWAARRAWITRDEARERFGDKAKDIPQAKSDPSLPDADKSKKSKIGVWEIWCKKSRKVYWVCEEYDELLDLQAPLFNVRGFFPCPAPAYGTIDPDTLVPIPEIVQYQDQVEEINTYTARIAALSESLRLKGFYASGAGDIATAIKSAMSSQDDRAILVPVPSLAAMGQGAAKDAIVWLPVTDVIQILQSLVEMRRVVIDDVYQITGISDIVRGNSDASETATAQQIKAQWGSQRIRERQTELSRMARDLTRITAEIMAEQFDPAMLKEMAQSRLPSADEKAQAEAIAQQAQAQGQSLPPELTGLLKKPSFDDVIAFLRNDRVRGFVIEVETDSTIQPDEDAEKKRRIEFVTTIGGLFQQTAPLVMQAPQMGPFIMEVMKFAAGGFRAGRPLEQAIDELGEQLKAMAEKAAQPTEPQPDPAIELKKAELALKKQESEARVSIEMQKMEFEQQKAAAQIGLEREKMSAKMDMDRAKHEAEIGLRRETEQARMANVNEGREASMKAAGSPPVTMHLDADEAIDAVAKKLEAMAHSFERMGEDERLEQDGDD